MCSCSVTASGDILFVNTSNGVDESHILLPSPDAPSFIAMDKNTGKVLWTDPSPGLNILHGQWSSPTYGVLGGVPQVLFAGGDGWLYSFDPAGGADGKSKLLWKFDCNPKESKWELGGRGTRNNLIATPVIYDDLVYVAVGQDPEHAEGNGHLWCIDPTKRGDVSPTLAFKIDDPENPIPPRRLQSVDPKQGEVARDNPNSAVVWHYAKSDQDGNGEFDWEEEMHRSCGTVAIKDDILYISDFSGLFHCLNAKTGKVHWTHDMLAAAWGSPLIVDGKVYIGDEDGDITIFEFSTEKKILSVDEYGDPGPINMGNSVYSTPIVSDNVLYISNKTHLFAIEAGGAKKVAQADPDTATE
jgi:outer membrane protein assembly factor BamB